MITKERLEELIEQGAIIYELFENKNINQIKLENNWTVLNGGLYKDINYIRSFWIGDLFDTKEEAEWYKEFGCIERTQRLELPTWEELQSNALYNVYFTTPEIEVYRLIFNMTREIITISVQDENFDFENRWLLLENYKLTKENYTLACRKAKELFLGLGEKK